MSGPRSRLADHEAVQALLSGRLAEDEARRVVEHLPADAESEARARVESDPLIRALRSLAARPLEPNPPLVAAVIRQVLAHTTCEAAVTTGDGLRQTYP